jgi:hypothetical protein
MKTCNLAKMLDMIALFYTSITPKIKTNRSYRVSQEEIPAT